MLGSRAARLTTLWLCSLCAAACQKATAVDFSITAPTNALLNPFSLSVSDYVLKTADGSVIAAVSAGASKDKSGRLSLGAINPALAGTLRLDVFSGLELVGLSYVENVRVEKGQTQTLLAQVRKPLVVVGAADAPEAMGPHKSPELLDPTTSSDLVAAGVAIPEAQASAFTNDGQHLLLGSAAGLYVFDTGSGLTSKPATMPFAPAIVAIAPNDTGVAFLERGMTTSRVAWYSDVAGLVSNPSSVMPTIATITTGLPRAAHFSPDGTTLYVLVEASGSEPCTGTTAPVANSIVPITAAGGISTLGTPILLPSYVADFAVEASGDLLLAESAANEIATLHIATPTAAPTTLYAATCPTALRLLDSDIYAISNDGATAGNLELIHGHLDGSTPTPLPIPLPKYQANLLNPPSTVLANQSDLTFLPNGIAATDMAVSPDGTRAVFAVRARYTRTSADTFSILLLPCTPGVDIVEYGLYSVDLTSGTASYSSRSQTVVSQTVTLTGLDGMFCAACNNTQIEFAVNCPSTAGDRATGLAAAFSEEP